MPNRTIDQKKLDEIFPPEKTDKFFDAIYGGAEEGAYDIRLACNGVDDKKADMAFNLTRRPGKCLKCSLTSGLPDVFKKHPVIDLDNTVKKIAAECGYGKNSTWELGNTKQVNDELNVIPLLIWNE